MLRNLEGQTESSVYIPKRELHDLDTIPSTAVTYLKLFGKHTLIIQMAH
jgi:hypothetical protein